PDWTVNAVIGDASWIERYGRAPVSGDSEIARVQAHLVYVLRALEQADTTHLTDAQRLRRVTLLAHLRGYTARGVFPTRRASDSFTGRRPRFIDDQGVRCAVGELIWASGHGELASRIDATQEYAYVPDIETPGLARWAQDHGFSASELALIQPSYGPPPSRRSVIAEIDQWKEHIVWTCARAHPSRKRVPVWLRGTREGEVSIAPAPLLGANPFAACAHEQLAAAHLGAGAWDEPPRPFVTRHTVVLPALDELAEARFMDETDRLQHTSCIPRPGAIPTQVDASAVAREGELSVQITTAPQNTAVEQCMTRKLDEAFGDLVGGRITFAFSRSLSLLPRVNTHWLELHLRAAVPTAATDCYSEDAPASIAVTAAAVQDAQAFNVEAAGDDASFAQCVEEAVGTRLLEALQVGVQQPDGSYAPYARIDGAVTITHTAAVVSPAEREARRKAAEREREMEMDWAY
ncbi:MAG: hypothetical protein AAFV53_28545, partial [Myxococcota bacterium]